MKEPKEEKGFEIGEFGGEVLNEWYAEREPVAVGLGKENLRDSLPQISAQTKSDEKNEQEIKRETIKAEIKELLNLSEKKGLAHAIEMAKRSNNPFLLDVFHDILAKDGNYKKILKE